MPIVLAPDLVVEVEPPPVPTLTVPLPPAPSVTVLPPDIPVTIAPVPEDPSVTVVPVVGPPGPAGPAGASTNASCVWPVPVPVYLVQVIHNLGFYPAGVTAIDVGGSPVESAKIAYISIDITEVSFDVPFSGTLYLS
jgi:hypothetical protein